MSFPTNDPDEQVKPIEFTLEDRDLILNLFTVDPEIENRFKLAAVKGNGIAVHLNAYDLDELLGEIAAVANHEKNRKQQRKLDALFQRVSDKLESEFPRS
jgi:hypothetical protein